MTRGLAYIDSMPPQAQPDARRYADRLTLRPLGTAGLVMRVLLTAPDAEFSVDELVRRTHASRANFSTAFGRLEVLGSITIRHDYDVPLRGGGCLRWLRITDQGCAAAAREGLTPAPPDVRAATVTVSQKKPK